MELVRREFGIREQAPPFRGLADGHKQGLICVGHLINLGLLSRFIDEMIAQVISNGTLEIVEARLNAFEYPSTWPRLTTKVILLKGRKMKPMSVALQIGLMAPILFQGLVDPQLLLLTSSLLRVLRLIMNPHHSDETITETQTMTREWITAACAYAALHKTVVMDLPNTHLLLELVMRVLPMTRDARAGLTTRYESQHQFPKSLEIRVKPNTSSKPENFALSQIAYLQGFRFMIRDGRWGDHFELKMGPDLAALLRNDRANPFKLPKVLRVCLPPPVVPALLVSRTTRIWRC